MQKDDLILVGHMLDTSEKAVSKVNGLDRADFNADENLRLALVHLIQTIGEAARRLSEQFGREALVLSEFDKCLASQ